MRKSKFITLCKRTVAVVLALMMTLTTFVDGSFVSYATSEASTLEYAGTEEGNELRISCFEFTDSFPFSEENVLAILNNKTATYDSIYIQYPDQTVTAVSAELWNAAVNRLNPDYEDRSVRYEFISDDSYNMTWYFNKPVITDADVTMQADITFGSSMTVNYASTTFPAEFSGLNLRTKSTKSDYAMISSLFGTETMELEYVDAAGNVITGCGRYEVSTWSDGETEIYYSHIQMRPLSRLTAGTTYALQESVYKGEVNTWVDGNGYTRTNLYIGWGGAGNGEAMTAQNILDILAYHEGTSFDGITIEQPASSNVIYKDVVNGAIDYLKTTGNQSITWNFNDYQNTKSSFQWILRVPSQMSADQTVSYTVGADAENAPYIMIGGCSNLTAEEISGHYWARKETAVAGYYQKYLGTDRMDIALGDSGTYGNYGLNEDNVWFNFYDLTGLTPGVKYTISKKVYEGNEWTGDWNGGTECFEINYHQMVNNGETFNDANVLNILNKKAQAGASYHSVRLFMPEGTTTVSADVWNALVDLLKTEISGNQGLEIQLGIDGGDSHNTYWTFMWPTHTDEAITLEVNKTWSTDQSGVEVSFPRVNYPAETVILNFDSNTNEKLDTANFINAFGSESISLEVVDADGNVISTNGYYSVNTWNNGQKGYSFNISSILWLNANETYRIQKYTYRGNVYNNPDGTSLDINYSGFERAGQEFNDENIIALLQSRQAAGEKFRWIHIQYPAGAEKTVSKEVWNQAYSLLDLDAEGVSFEFSFESENSFMESWSFNWPEPTETDITMGSTITFQGGEGMDVAVANVEYPADSVWLQLNTNTYDSATSAAFIEAFGSEYKRLEMIDADGNVVEDTHGNYNVDSWTNYLDEVITEYRVHIGNIMRLTPNTTYRVQEHIYKGDIHSWEDNGVTYYQLDINPWGAGKDGAAFTKDELIAILQANAGKEYTEIYIDQASSSENIIYKDVVNEALKILKQDDWNKINFNFVNYDSGYGYGVGIENPSAMTEDQVVSFELGLKKEKATVTINNTFDNINAEWLNIHSFMPYDSEMGTVFREIYGEGRYSLILEETGHPAYYEANEDSVWIDVYDMADLEAGTYTFALEDYKGDVYGDDEYSYLNIDWGRFADYGLEYSEEAVVAILEDWAAIGEQFNGVHITYPSKDDTVVAKEVWNAAAALIKEDTDGRYEETPYLSIMFDDYETYGVEWRLKQPKETGKDVNLKTTVTFNTNGNGVGLKFANSSYPALGVDYIIYTNTERSDASLFTGALGDVRMDIRLSLNGKATAVEGGYWVDYYDEGVVSYSIGLNGVQGLKTTVTYKVEEKPYAGFVESWGDEEYEITCLNINPWDAGKEGALLSDEFIIEVLSRNEGTLFDQIYVEQPASESNVISAAVVNTAKELLKADGEKLLKFGFVDYDNGTANEIWLRDPSEQAEDKVVTAHAAVDEAGVPYLHAGNLEGLGSTDITLWHAAPFAGEEGTALLNYFELSRAITAEDTNLEGSFNVNDDQVWIHIGNIYELEADRNYTLVNKVYKGDVEGENQEILSIYWWRFEETGESFCDEAVLEILQEKAAAGEKFDQVFIGYPSQDITAIPKDIWNAAVALLNEVTEDEQEVTLQIALENGENYDYYWIFRNPMGVDEDVQLGQPEFSLVTGLGMLISFDRNEFPAAKTIYQLNTYAKREEFIKTFGEEHMYLDVVRNDNPNALVEPNTRGYYGVDEWSAWVMVGDVAALDVNTKYQVQEYVYRGEIFEDGRVLDIRASELGKATITSEDLGNIVGYYFKRGMSFECINVFQDYTKNNVISKSVINFLRNILNSENGELRFVFDRSEETETDYFVNEVAWSLYRPWEATKDINANVTLTTTANQGAVIKVNANEYAAEQVFVSLHTDRGSSLGEELAAGLGEAPVFVEGEEEPYSRLVALKKGTELVDYLPIHYQNYDGHIYLDIVEVRELAADVNYTLLQKTFIEDTVEVGESYVMTEQLAHTPEGKVTWKSFTQDVADITAAGVFTAANEGEFYVMATYKSEGKTYKEMLYGYAEIILKDIAFENAKMELELYPDVYDNLNFVKVLTYPANAYVDPNELEWSVTGDDILILGDGGNFIAAGLGTAVIMATVPGTDISASCEVKVIEYTRVSDEVVEALDKLYIVTNFDTTLADVELPAGCEWKEPATKLNTYVGLTTGTFPIMYTASNGRTIELTWNIPIMTIKDIHMYLANSGSIYFKRGSEDAVFAYGVEVTNGTFEDIKNHKAFDSLIVKPTGMVSTAEVSEYAEDYPDCFVLKTTESTKTGKTTLKLDLVYKGKSIANDSFVVYVTKDYVGGFNGFELAVEDDNDGNANTAILVLKFNDARYYYKPSVKISDTSILKLGKFTYPTEADKEAAIANGTAIEIRIPYTEVKAGDAGIEITLADEVKSKITYIYTVFDRQPKVLEPSFTINTEYDFKKAPISIQYTNYYGIHPDYSETPVIVMDDRFQFNYYRFDSETGRVYGWLEIKEGASVKNGTYSVKLYTPIDVTFDKEYLEIADEELLQALSEQYVTVKVKVSNAKPSVTIKQTEKVNLFFDQSEGSEDFIPEGCGTLVLSTKNGYVKDVSMTGTNDFEMVKWGGYYVIYYKPDNDGVIDKTATLTYSIINYENGLISNQTKNITIATVNKAPSVKLDKKSDTLYPGYGTSYIYLYNDNSGKYIQIDEISWVKSAKEIIPLSLDEEGTFISTAKSDYLIKVYESVVEFNLVAGQNTTDKIKLRIKQDEWSKPVDVTYSITTKWTAPKLKLTSSKLTLNVNEEVYQNQVAGTYILLDGYQDLPYGLNVRFTGADAKSKAVLNDQIMLSYEYDQIVARFNIDPKESTRPSGSYKFKVWVDNGMFETSTNLTVNVVNQPVAKNVKLTKSGSIDVLRRDTTYLTYKPKLTNLSGWVVDAYLVGANSDKFYAEWSWWNNGINVYAYEGAELSTSVNYKLTFELALQNEDGSVYIITTPAQSVKVTQSKPKVTFDSYEGTALYTQAGNTLTTGIEAALKNEYIEIENVTLANYNYDLALSFDKDNQRFTLSRRGWYEIIKSGKVWSLKLNVTFRDQAGNVKDTQVTYKVKVQ